MDTMKDIKEIKTMPPAVKEAIKEAVQEIKQDPNLIQVQQGNTEIIMIKLLDSMNTRMKNLEVFQHSMNESLKRLADKLAPLPDTKEIKYEEPEPEN